MKRVYILICLLYVLAIYSCKDEKVPQEFSVACQEYKVGSKGGSFSTSVVSNYDWSASSPNYWMTITVNNKENDYVKVMVEKNTTLEDRTGSVIIQSGDWSHTIKVFQERSSDIVLSETDYKLSDEGGSISVELEANATYGIKITEEWIQEDASSRAMEGHTHAFVISPNETFDDRSGYIIFEMKDKADTVTVWQSQKDGLILTEKGQVVHEDGGQISFEVKANVNYSYQIEEGIDWISEIKTRALNSHSHTFTFDRNDFKKDRVAKIIFTSKDSDLQEVLTITQNGQMGIFMIIHSNMIWDIPVLEGNNVTGYVDWGDENETEEYSEYLTHQYNHSDEYQVNISAKGVESVKLDNLIKVSTIDLSKF